MAGRAAVSYIYFRCATALLRPGRRVPGDPRPGLRQFSSGAPTPSDSRATTKSHEKSEAAAKDAASKPEPGPMARRLEEATEDALFSGGRAGRRAVEDAGFSDELKERLLAKVQDAQFRSEFSSAFAEAGMPTAAGQGTRLTAASQPWAGEETAEDAVLRMLNDAHKPLKPGLRGPAKLPNLQPIDMRMRRDTTSPGQRAASAREKATAYTGMGLKETEKSLNDKEREAMRKEFRDRFRPAARAMPTTLTGLASLANERIEDAIARGQFKNIPRGKGIERDTRADNPFIDTTEYIMNKMIKRQEIVPPWIEKQQELVKAAHNFRSRLRTDWRRHAARMIASKGGTLEEQMNRAREYARAEEVHNPRKRNVEQISVPTNVTDDPVMMKIRHQLVAEAAIELSEEPSSIASTPNPPHLPVELDAPLEVASVSQPFRDPDWLGLERSYIDLAITNLNSLTRSYNLMAPELARKPYFSVERELNACFADVAPQLANAIKDRAAGPSKSFVGAGGHRPRGILDHFGREGHSSKFYESKAPRYGFKEFWRDIFQRRAS